MASTSDIAIKAGAGHLVFVSRGGAAIGVVFRRVIKIGPKMPKVMYWTYTIDGENPSETRFETRREAVAALNTATS